MTGWVEYDNAEALPKHEVSPDTHGEEDTLPLLQLIQEFATNRLRLVDLSEVGSLMDTHFPDLDEFCVAEDIGEFHVVYLSLPSDRSKCTGLLIQSSGGNLLHIQL